MHNRGVTSGQPNRQNSIYCGYRAHIAIKAVLYLVRAAVLVLWRSYGFFFRCVFFYYGFLFILPLISTIIRNAIITRGEIIKLRPWWHLLTTNIVSVQKNRGNSILALYLFFVGHLYSTRALLSHSPHSLSSSCLSILLLFLILSFVRPSFSLPFPVFPSF